MKSGFEYRVFYNNSFSDATGGSVNFSSIANFLAGIPSTTSLQTGDVTPALVIRSFAGYAQDDYKILPHLTLNLGLRYEFNTVPTERLAYSMPTRSRRTGSLTQALLLVSVTVF